MDAGIPAKTPFAIGLADRGWRHAPGCIKVTGPRDVPARSTSKDSETLDINPASLMLCWPLRTATAHGRPSSRLRRAAPLR